MNNSSLTPSSEADEQTSYSIRAFVKRYGSTVEAAESLCVSEAWIWNRLPADDREVRDDPA